MDTEMTRGAVYIAYGWRAVKEAGYSIATLRQHNDLPVTVIGERVDGTAHIAFDDQDSAGRWAKCNLDRLSPYDWTLYLDADTRVHGAIHGGYDILGGGWDVAIAPSKVQGDGILWHVSDDERAATRAELGHDLLQLQGGMMFWRKNERTRAFFQAWREEWERWQGQDQAALLRALHRTPLRLWLLSNEWNGGSLIEHRYGSARRRE
jgi:hypothetical protein